MGSRKLHVGVAKWLLLELLKAHGAGEVLVGWQGTDAEAREVIQADPREFFVLDTSCDRQGPDGACLGHELEG